MGQNLAVIRVWGDFMIYVPLNRSGFEYDIYNLVRSFLPGVRIGFLYPKELAAGLEGGKTASEALAAYQRQSERAKKNLAYWQAQLLARQSPGKEQRRRNPKAEPTGERPVSLLPQMKRMHANHHERNLEDLQEKLSKARGQLQEALEGQPAAVLLVEIQDDRIRLRWEPDAEESENMMRVLSLADDRELPLIPILSGLLSAVPGRTYEERIPSFQEGRTSASPEGQVESPFLFQMQACREFERPEDMPRAGEREVLHRREQKNALKRLIYRALSRNLGKELPWGTLSGIRPTKILLGKLASGASEEEAIRWMKEGYLVSDHKLATCIKIVGREREVLNKIHTAGGIGGAGDGKKGYSLYLNIPFCPSTCLYCSFTSYPEGKYASVMADYVSALEKEIDYVREDFQDKKKRVLDSIYIGGGTPTSLSAELLDRLLGYMESKLNLDQLKEWTIEAGRPDSITEAKLDAIKKHGVTRISINPQTMKDETLRLIGRHHTTEQIRKAYAMARAKGFDDINMDLIIGLPGESREDVERTLQEIAAMGPENLTVHSLALKRTARLNLRREEYKSYVMESSDQMMELAALYAGQMGLSPYYLYRQKNIAGNQENVGYAREGYECIYNIAIMEEQQDIVALGCGADSKKILENGTTDRCENVKNVEEYIVRVDQMIERKRKLFCEMD